MTVDTKEVVTTISYLIGVRKDILETHFAECKDTLDKLYADREATVIRYLCKLRTALLQHFKKTDNAMHYDLKSLKLWIVICQVVFCTMFTVLFWLLFCGC